MGLLSAKPGVSRVVFYEGVESWKSDGGEELSDIGRKGLLRRLIFEGLRRVKVSYKDILVLWEALKLIFGLDS